MTVPGVPARRILVVFILLLTPDAALGLGPKSLTEPCETRPGLSVSASTSATTATTATAPPVVDTLSVVVTGPGFTGADTVRDALDLGACDVYEPHLLDLSVRRLWDYEIYQAVTAETIRTADGVTIEVRVRDRWSLIPVFRPNLGGGIFKLLLGARDTNFLGENRDVALYGGIYHSFDDNATDWVAGGWWLDKQFFGRHYLYTLLNRDFTTDPYYLGGTSPATVLEKQIEEGYVEFLYQGSDTWQPGVFFYGARRRYELQGGLEPDDAGSLGQPLPGSLWGLRPGLLFRAGEVHQRQYRYTGADAVVGLFHEFRPPGLGEFSGGFVRLRGFLLPHSRINLAARLQLEARNNRFRVDDLAYGGLNTLRGFPQQYLRGTKAALLNSEVRVVLVDHLFDFLFLQGNVFYDVAVMDAAGPFRQRTHTAQGAGAGIRIGVVQIHGTFLRLDVGRPVDRGGLGPDISMGVVQFF